MALTAGCWREVDIGEVWTDSCHLCIFYCPVLGTNSEQSHAEEFLSPPKIRLLYPLLLSYCFVSSLLGDLAFDESNIPFLPMALPGMQEHNGF